MLLLFSQPEAANIHKLQAEVLMLERQKKEVKLFMVTYAGMFSQLSSTEVFFPCDLASVYQQRVGEPLQSHGTVLQRKGRGKKCYTAN